MNCETPSIIDKVIPEQFYQIINEDGHHSSNAYLHSMNHIFNGIDFKNKKVLDIGSGKGLMTIYAALNGARKVVSLEPELEGAGSDVLEIQNSRIKKMGLNNVEILRQDFNTWQYDEEPFDIILSFASINHLYESPYNALHNKEVYQKYLKIAASMKELLNENGVAVITDACRYGLFFLLKEVGINRPWAAKKKTNVNYRFHQNPNVWKKIFLQAGFSNVRIKYPLPFKLRRFKGIVDNALGNFLLKARFIIYCGV